MKKIIVLLLALVMILSLVACGGNNATDPDNKNNPSQTQTDATKDNKDNKDTKDNKDNKGGKTETNDLSTVEGYLAQYGYTVDDFNFTKDFSKVEYSSQKVLPDNKYEITEIGVFQTAKKSNDEKQAWLEAFVNLLKTKSEDGKVYAYGIIDGVSSEEYVAKYNPDDFVFVTRMAYKFNGKTVIATLSYHNGLDNEDPDEADYLVGVEFEFMKTY